MRLLVVGGTGEARALAAELVDDPGLQVVSSLAGAVQRPRLPEGEVRVGGFGGASGLADWLRDNEIAAVVDASHPFASRISASCVQAAAATRTPLLRLERPPWRADPDDEWHLVPDIATAAASLRALGRRALLTTGRRDLPVFAALHDLWLLARCVDPPATPPPPHVQVLLDRGPYTVGGETDLMRRHAIDVLVTKNSGGDLTVAKLRAARELGIPVLMVQRPEPEQLAPVVVADVAAAVAWARGLVPQ